MISIEPGLNRRILQPPAKKGDSVSFKVLRKISKQKWLIQIGDSRKTVVSMLGLRENLSYSGRFARDKNIIIVNLSPDTNSVDQFIKDNNLIFDSLTRDICFSMIEIGSILIPEKIREYYSYFSKKQKKYRYLMKFLAILDEKNIKISGDQLEKIFGYLSSGNGKKQKNEKRSREKLSAKKIISEIRNKVEKIEKKEDLLFLFNHMKTQRDNWVVLPFEFLKEKIKIYGSIKLKIGLPSNKIDSVNIVVVSEKRKWIFSIKDYKKKNKRMNIFVNQKSGSMDEFVSLKKKLQKKSVTIDDIMYNDCMDDFLMDKVNYLKKINVSA